MGILIIATIVVVGDINVKKFSRFFSSYYSMRFNVSVKLKSMKQSPTNETKSKVVMCDDKKLDEIVLRK